MCNTLVPDVDELSGTTNCVKLPASVTSIMRCCTTAMRDTDTGVIRGTGTPYGMRTDTHMQQRHGYALIARLKLCGTHTARFARTQCIRCHGVQRA